MSRKCPGCYTDRSRDHGGEQVVLTVGARRRDRLVEALGALDLRLATDGLARIESAVPEGAAAGEHYPAPILAHMDSERSPAR